MQNRMKGFASLLLSGLIFGSFGIWIRLLSAELTSFQQIALRNLIGLIFAVLIVCVLRQKWSFKNVKAWHVFGYAISFPIAVSFYVFSALQTKLSTSLFAFYASSLVVSFIISKYVFNEKNSRNKLISLGVALIGVYIIISPLTKETLNIGFLYGLMAGLFDTITSGFKRVLSGNVDRFVLVSTQMFGALVIASILLLFKGQPVFIRMSLPTLLVAVVFGFLLMMISFLTLVGFQNFDINLGTIVISSEIIFATIFAALLFAEYPSVKEVIGGLCITGSIILTNIKT